MRLYKSSNGQWFGTQRDAQRGAPRDWTEVDVPTSKQDLINWLNANKVGGGYDKPVDTPDFVDIDCPENVSPYPDYLDDDLEDEKLIKSAASWVAWALDNLERGDTTTAKEMLKLGLKAQKGVA